jgi:hypothetical protein
MPRFDPTEFGRLLARLTPQELRQVEGLVADARKRAEAVLEIDARADAGGPAASCPSCGPELWARVVAATRAPGGVGPEQAHSDGTARGAGRRGQAAAGRRWPGFTAPTWWSRWRVT